MFITFEGIEGCGKTTQVRRLASLLEAAGHTVVTTREPGGTLIADKIRSILLDAENTGLVPLAELLLYAASRAQHVAEVIRPALAEGKVVICDRYTDATLAYQGYGRGLDVEVIEHLNGVASGDLLPDLTILLDCPVEVGLRRAMARIETTEGAREERFEREALDFHERVREGYLKIAGSGSRFIVIPADGDPSEVAVSVSSAVLSRLGER